jgi:hypothetical protein
MGWVASSTPVPNQAAPDPCVTTDPVRRIPQLLSPERQPNLPSVFIPNTVPNLILYQNLLTIQEQKVTFPASTFLLQDGAIEPIYPIYLGNFVYDLHLKKWGKAGNQYKKLFEMFPINSQSGQIIPYEVFGSDSAILDSAGFIYLHDDTPLDSQITYGKIGYFRKGFTNAEEVKLQFSKVSTGILSLDGSLDGKSLSTLISTVTAFEDVDYITLYSSVSARWYNITISGIFDISGLEFRGHVKGRR